MSSRKLMVNFALVAGVLCVCIHSAQNLLPMDKNGLSDPYCIVYENKREVNIVRPPPPPPSLFSTWRFFSREQANS